MGTWGPGVYSNDTAADLKDDYRDLVAEGLTPSEATSRLIAEYGVGSDPGADNDFWLALAVTGHKIGHLAPDALARGIAVLDDPAELNRWPEASRRQRRAALEKIRQTLSAPVPEPKRLRVRTKVDTSLVPGQHVEWSLGHGKPAALFRVLDVGQDKGGRYPILLALRWDGSERARKNAHRLDALPGGFDAMRQREVALGFMACGRPGDPPGLRLVGSPADRRTPSVGLNVHRYVVPWTEMHRFFTASGKAAIPPEAPQRRSSNST